MIFYGRKKIQKNREGANHLSLLIVVIFIFYCLIIFRLVDLQILKRDFYQALASESQQFSQDLLPVRGEIFTNDKDGNIYPVASNLDLYLVYAEPARIKNFEEAAEKIALMLELDREEVKTKLAKKNDLYEVLKHYVNKEKVSEIEKLNIAGIKFSSEIKRYYPEKNLFCHLSGFVGYKGKEKIGQYGLEEYYEKALTGIIGNMKAKKTALGSLIFSADYNIEKAKDGADLFLTIDRTIQFKACEELKKSIKEYGAEKGTVIIMEPQTGKILALCNYPDFDPNNYGQTEDLKSFYNQAISDNYEPGSIFKAITMATALDEGAVNPDTTYKDEGFVKIDSHIIRNSDKKEHGTVNMTNVLEASLNTGVIFAVRKIGDQNFRKYVEKFGFGKITGIELPGEAEGDTSSLSKKNEIYSATASFGQGISVTPLQMVNAFSAIANGGKLMKPYLVEKKSYPNGEIEENKPQFIKEVISPSTASALSAMLVSVVENGHGKQAGVKGYYVAGKTGTAQVAKENGGGYEENKSIGSFAGFAPVDNPKFAMLVKIDNPRDITWAESTAAPLFGKLAEFMLSYYQIPPVR